VGNMATENMLRWVGEKGLETGIVIPEFEKAVQQAQLIFGN